MQISLGQKMLKHRTFSELQGGAHDFSEKPAQQKSQSIRPRCHQKPLDPEKAVDATEGREDGSVQESKGYALALPVAKKRVKRRRPGFSRPHADCPQEGTPSFGSPYCTRQGCKLNIFACFSKPPVCSLSLEQNTDSLAPKRKKGDLHAKTQRRFAPWPL
ncbi:hypothetical protein TRVL_01813 [Trypanosoma vivax]|nr:hypothetical protein TRVL_01813 [Trypanosoma vivax]